MLANLLPYFCGTILLPKSAGQDERLEEETKLLSKEEYNSNIGKYKILCYLILFFFISYAVSFS